MEKKNSLEMISEDHLIQLLLKAGLPSKPDQAALGLVEA